MALSVNNTDIKSMQCAMNGGTPAAIHKLTYNNAVVWQSGNQVTYVADGGTYTERVEYGQSCLSPTSFTPSKSGYTFAGWSTSSASTTVETNIVMGESAITLYAVWQRNENASVEMANGRKYGNTFGANSSSFLLGSFDATGYDKVNFPYSKNAGQVFLISYLNNTTGRVDDTVYVIIGSTRFPVLRGYSNKDGGGIGVDEVYNEAVAEIISSGSKINLGGNANGWTFDISALSGTVNVYLDTATRINASGYSGFQGMLGYGLEEATLIAGKVVG